MLSKAQLFEIAQDVYVTPKSTKLFMDCEDEGSVPMWLVVGVAITVVIIALMVWFLFL
jgi:hypothetical protein